MGEYLKGRTRQAKPSEDIKYIPKPVASGNFPSMLFPEEYSRHNYSNIWATRLILSSSLSLTWTKWRQGGKTLSRDYSGGRARPRKTE